jgi:hypothetical protein
MTPPSWSSSIFPASLLRADMVICEGYARGTERVHEGKVDKN